MSKLFNKDITIHIAPLSVVIALAVVLSFYGFYLLYNLFVLIFFAFLLMVALNPVVKRLERGLKIPKSFAILIAYVLVLVVLGSFIAFLVPPLVRQATQLLKVIHIPVVEDLLGDLTLNLSQLSTILERLGDSVGFAYTAISSAFNGLITLFTLFVLTFYLILERPDLYKKVAWFTTRKEDMELAKNLIDKIELQLGGWVRGQLVLMFVIGVMTYVGLVLLSVPFALPLALLAGLLEIVPNLGPTIAAVPAALIAFLTAGPVVGWLVVGLYFLIQQLENNIIVPRVMKKNADVNPVITIVVILAGVELSGILGALLAVPVYIIVRTLYFVFFAEMRRK